MYKRDQLGLIAQYKEQHKQQKHKIEHESRHTAQNRRRHAGELLAHHRRRRQCLTADIIGLERAIRQHASQALPALDQPGMGQKLLYIILRCPLSHDYRVIDALLQNSPEQNQGGYENDKHQQQTTDDGRRRLPPAQHLKQSLVHGLCQQTDQDGKDNRLQVRLEHPQA